MRSQSPVRFLILIFVLTLPIAAAAQSARGNEGRLEALQSLLTAVETREQEVARLRSELEEARTLPGKERLRERLEEKSGRLEEIRNRFRESAAGIDDSLFETQPEEAFSWENTLGKILEPVLDEIEKATAASRKRAQLEEETAFFEERAKVAEQALSRLSQTIAEATNPALVEALKAERERWRERLVLAESRANAARLELRGFKANNPGVIGGTTSFIRDFLAERGLNLLLGILAAMGVFFGLRILLLLFRGIGPSTRSNTFAGRLFLLLTNLLSVIGAIAALLVTFSAAGDLFLLGIVLIFLIGAAWAGIRVVPQFVESLKLILNIGMVREEQRIEFDGVPWNVASLGFACILENKDLDHARQQLPVRHLVGLHSRPWCADEPAFPMRRGEWVQLADKTIGESIAQSPGMITLREWGGALVTYPTPDFLNQRPRNLSRNGFRVLSRFRLDYGHREEVTTTIREQLEEALRTGIPEIVGDGAVREARVRFAAARTSSLDLEAEVDLDGSAAPQYRELRFWIQQIFVEACQRHGLTIPFPHITVHKRGTGPGLEI